MIRLARYGRKKKPFYRVVVTDKDSSRDGRFIELVGRYNPLTEPPVVELNKERIEHWVSVGAKPTDTLASFIEKQFPGLFSKLDDARKANVRSRRAKRKAKAGGKIANKASEAKSKRKARATREKVMPVKKEAAAE